MLVLSKDVVFQLPELYCELIETNPINKVFTME